MKSVAIAAKRNNLVRSPGGVIPILLQIELFDSDGRNSARPAWNEHFPNPKSKGRTRTHKDAQGTCPMDANRILLIPPGEIRAGA